MIEVEESVVLVSARAVVASAFEEWARAVAAFERQDAGSGDGDVLELRFRQLTGALELTRRSVARWQVLSGRAWGAFCSELGCAGFGVPVWEGPACPDDHLSVLDVGSDEVD